MLLTFDCRNNNIVVCVILPQIQRCASSLPSKGE